MEVQCALSAEIRSVPLVPDQSLNGLNSSQSDLHRCSGTWHPLCSTPVRSFFCTGGLYYIEALNPFACAVAAPLLPFSLSQWIPQWVHLWSSIPHCPFWDIQWLTLLGRCAKHLPPHAYLPLPGSNPPADATSAGATSAGAVWAPFLPFMFQQAVNSLGLPIGQSPSSTPGLTRTAPPSALRLLFGGFGGSQGKGSRAEPGAKLIVWLLPICRAPVSQVGPTSGPGAAGTVAGATTADAGSTGPVGAVVGGEVSRGKSALALLESLVNMVEQFCHPSNGGDWNRDLTRFIRGLSTHFLKLLQRPLAQPSDPRAPLPAVKQAVGATQKEGLTEREVLRFVRAAMRMVHHRAIFSKSGELSQAASEAAARYAAVAPSVVLPMVLEMFETAIGTDTATHQLETAIYTLALAVRPLLQATATREEAAPANPTPSEGVGSTAYSGTPAASTASYSDSTGECDSLYELPLEALDRAQVLLSEAMFAVLPGIDANDPPKTEAAFQFFCSVLSSTTVQYSSFLRAQYSLVQCFPLALSEDCYSTVPSCSVQFGTVLADTAFFQFFCKGTLLFGCLYGGAVVR